MTEKKKDEIIKLDPKTDAVFKKKHYKVEKKLNEGAFGQVYKGYNTKTGDQVAVKVMDLDKVGSKFKEKFLDREINALISIRHENVIYIYDIIRANNKYYIFMEFANGGDLTHYLQDNGPMPEALACYWFTQVSSALCYLHVEMKVAHRDIKIDNVLLHNNVAKLTDFGFAKDLTREPVTLSKTFCGTEPYYSPQIVIRKPYNVFAADVWAMGVMLFCMLNNKFPFHFGDAKRMYKEQTDPNFIKERYVKRFSEDLRDLQEKFFEPEESNRIKIPMVLEHSWILRKGK